MEQSERVSSIPVGHKTCCLESPCDAICFWNLCLEILYLSSVDHFEHNDTRPGHILRFASWGVSTKATWIPGESRCLPQESPLHPRQSLLALISGKSESSCVYMLLLDVVPIWPGGKQGYIVFILHEGGGSLLLDCRSSVLIMWRKQRSICRVRWCHLQGTLRSTSQEFPERVDWWLL